MDFKEHLVVVVSETHDGVMKMDVVESSRPISMDRVVEYYEKVRGLSWTSDAVYVFRNEDVSLIDLDNPVDIFSDE